MSKKSKRAGLDSTTPYGIGVYEDAKARLKYQTLMQDYEELQKVVNFILFYFFFLGFVLLLCFWRSDVLFCYFISGPFFLNVCLLVELICFFLTAVVIFVLGCVLIDVFLCFIDGFLMFLVVSGDICDILYEDIS